MSSSETPRVLEVHRSGLRPNNSVLVCSRASPPLRSRSAAAAIISMTKNLGTPSPRSLGRRLRFGRPTVLSVRRPKHVEQLKRRQVEQAASNGAADLPHGITLWRRGCLRCFCAPLESSRSSCSLQVAGRANVKEARTLNTLEEFIYASAMEVIKRDARLCEKSKDGSHLVSHSADSSAPHGERSQAHTDGDSTALARGRASFSERLVGRFSGTRPRNAFSPPRRRAGPSRAKNSCLAACCYPATLSARCAKRRLKNEVRKVEEVLLFRL